MKSALSFCVLLACNIPMAFCDLIQVDPTTRRFVDEYGRERIFHGVNSVYKIPPYYPQLKGFTSQTSLSPLDMDRLQKWGFNALRLGVMWPGVAPIRGQFNESYLTVMKTIADELAQRNIYTLVDCHQDLFSRQFCGEGAPGWAVKTGNFSFPFPLPATLKEFSIGPHGYPPLKECLQHVFGLYYLAEQTGAAFQSLYDNVDGIQDEFAAYWSKVASVFSASPKLLGYELLNEPWVGNPFFDVKLMAPGVADKLNLQPMYQKLNDALRQSDDEHIVFFEKTIESILFPAGFTDTPGGPAYNNRQALSFHDYCGPTNRAGVPSNDFVCYTENILIFDTALEDMKSLGIAGMMTEFGAMPNASKTITNIHNLTELADKHLQGWMYWQYKTFNDITTAGDGESFYDSEGQLEVNKVKALSRTYVQACAGHIQSMTFTPGSALFRLEYVMNTTIGAPTEIYLNEEWFYPNGYDVSMSPAALADWGTPHTNLVQIKPLPYAKQGTQLTVIISAK